jgi:hypothetical protein
MDFVICLPQTPSEQNVIWVIIDRLTKSAHFLPFKTTKFNGEGGRVVCREIVRLHGVPIFTVSNRDARSFGKGYRKKLELS